MPTVADLSQGQKGIIKNFSEDMLPIKLMELGCLPGNSIELVQIAPLNDPLYVNLSGCHIAIRRSLAQLIELEIVDDTQIP
ncbi:ferrous iron transport protein A [Muricauda sp. JGD-17]|uniref:Ferrous iron transport protein A n=1 Tax=Flagellimonas ochracea TaxID=2696472 RepID=A0A964TAS8_9FLAO|nr:FeoA family protein [Allomuricauda ochracea]NAY91430.1 ferrous iron transport protein A [Allomuricauda ochracea]